MSDFLTSLLVRNLGTGTSLRPRLASLYEPDTLYGGVLNGQSSLPLDVPFAPLDQNSEETEESSASLSPKPSADAEMERLRLLLAHERERAIADLSSSVRTSEAASGPMTNPPRPLNQPPPRPAVASQARSESASPQIQESPQPIRDDAQDVGQVGPTPRAFVAHTEASAAPAQGERRTRELLDSNHPTHVDAPHRRAPEAVAPAHRVGPIETRTVSERITHGREAQPPAGLLAHPQVVARVEAGEAARHAEAAREPAPVINVTIGRIEVRATTATESAESKSRMQPAQAPGASLDEYLRRRAGGGGRR
jgi:hypothetical protein